MQHISVKAFAKINLGLLITGKRPDGYHTLETVFAPVNWYDELTFSSADELSMTCSNLDLPSDDNNLCLKAANALRDYAEMSKGATIRLTKNIPFGAGLGGGSSDAATTLKVLNVLWEIHAPSDDLHALAVKLGADVPYFLESSGLAFASGIGEELLDLERFLPFYIVTVFPGEHISTVWAYKNFYPKFERKVPDLKEMLIELCEGKDLTVLPAFENDFEGVVFDYYPSVRQVKERLLEEGALFASLSGSGSAVFGLFDRQDAAEKAMLAFGEKGKACLTPPSFEMMQ
ncbi:4-(cytidine 5'-diphospho)-2-C-methyl-D-erythritol kinase [Prosthecochloris sp.]|uniref:4-(cytidine 5'-diphospho)-2-C-methyl-D-erythritol kinase n=1 Tax=Prosthecochloris sp. TaxID=290513 RepID=UPI0026009097|nr:4-(cytidine 5'-diphospho)-2-C-methyl-D-erythritol kinase [Prosthecochloris sp.]